MCPIILWSDSWNFGRALDSRLDDVESVQNDTRSENKSRGREDQNARGIQNRADRASDCTRQQVVPHFGSFILKVLGRECCTVDSDRNSQDQPPVWVITL